MAKAAGDRIGRYVIDRRLGAGGMAEAYLARQEGMAGFAKPVVIKVLHAWRAAEAKTVASFLREARVGARLSHKNIVQVLDVGEDRGEHYIVLEYVDGLTLLQLAKRCWSISEGLPVDVAVRVGVAAAAALEYAHAAGTVHRDISPDNIIIAKDGTVKLLDFGVAKVEGADATKGSEIKGKVPYMSPEQLVAGDVDARTDLWSLGVTLYWALAGKRPFVGEGELGTMRAILEDKPVPLRTRCPAASVKLEHLVHQLLQRDKDKRVQTAAELGKR
ncbi:MAG TPA: serine/threonine-protein kinase, partial [Myxococcota bacterium]